MGVLQCMDGQVVMWMYFLTTMAGCTPTLMEMRWVLVMARLIGGSGGDNPNSRFSIHNLEIGGTVVMGPEPRKCGQRCAEFCSSTGCGWTSEWSCPWQPRGSKGQASDDGSDGYDCCCKQRTAESQPCGGGRRGPAFNTTRPYLI